MEQTDLSHSGEPFGVALVPLNLVPVIWPRVAEIMEANPPERSPFFSTIPQAFQTVMNAKANLWIGGYGSGLDIVLMGTIVDYPAARGYIVNYVGGKFLRATLKHWPKLEQFAAAQGCTHIEMVTRPGIVRLMRRYGFEPLATYSCKSIWPQLN